MSFDVFHLSPVESQALLLSLKVAACATLCSLPPAILCAYLLARGRFWGHAVLNVLVVLPLVLPPVVTGYVLLLTFGKYGPLGQLLAACCGLSVAFRWTGAALAAGIMSFPLMVRSIRLSFEAVDPRLEQAAAILGADRLRVFCFVTLPLAWPGLCAAVVLGMAKALGEFGATIAFVANIPGETQTLSLALYSELQVPNGEPAALRLMILSIILATGAIALAEFLARKGRAG